MNFEVDYTVFIAMLRQERLKSGITQIDIAESLKKPQSYVSKYESGQRKIDVIEFINICHAMNINASLFLIEVERKINETRS